MEIDNSERREFIKKTLFRRIIFLSLCRLYWSRKRLPTKSITYGSCSLNIHVLPHLPYKSERPHDKFWPMNCGWECVTSSWFMNRLTLQLSCHLYWWSWRPHVEMTKTTWWKQFEHLNHYLERHSTEEVPLTDFV